ncbi:MAG: Inositol-phosphate phosphatase [Actinomycetia bacterium]|nr:Inositol-phosphate phosphatase [Actinomycetes bacterium]
MIPSGGEAVAVARQVAAEAGELLQRIRAEGPLSTSLKNGHELVTSADLRSDELIRRSLATRYPEHRIVTEETWDGWHPGLFDGPVWIADPLDGTVNYAHGHPYWSVSLAFAVDGEVRAGAVCGPAMGQMFTAVRGGGAWLGDQPLRVGAPASLAEALVGTGFPHDRSEVGGAVERIRRLVTHCRDVRRMGSPALDICWVGAGMLDAHCESLAPWDLAAAALVATEAGASRTAIEPQPFPLPPDLACAGFLVAAPTIFGGLTALLSGQRP